MSEQKTPYERVVASMHGVDDTIRDLVVYPSNREVIGISEGRKELVLHYASKDQEDEPVQTIWISAGPHNDHLEALVALAESISRVLTRAQAKPKE